MLFRRWDKYRELGILLLRVGIGLMFMYHGWPKIVGGTETWVKLGMAMKFLGVSFAPAFWGFMSAVTEFIGGFLIAIGLLTRPVAMFLSFNMIVAVVLKFSSGAGLGGASQAIEVGIVFLSLILMGPGRYSIDERLLR
ncbi:DoxX family protein [Anaerosporomusa subterranea]|uniref:DoxX family protein n=1 Tax=Anaerosporomusa subterranea TaxID=1794912 RepID=A0A154BUZ4_ANASB|nr:DoxX family protein [Anaerosporomusa subterranea]KYZ77761.1 DoxX family protein [Anaerosporomusa subterranea]